MSDNSNDKIKGLFNWCVNQTKDYKNVQIKNFTNSWKNGLGFCAILHRFDPDLIDYDNLNPQNIYENCDLAFNVAEKHFGIPSLLNPKDMVIMKSPDRLCMITYLSQYYNALSKKQPKELKPENLKLLSSIENLNKDAKVSEQKTIKEDDNENDPSLSDKRSENHKCEICSEIIYFLEKLTVADKFYHRSCYRKNQLSNLKIRNKTLERPTVPVSDQIESSNPKEENIVPALLDLSSVNKSPQKSQRKPSLDSNMSENNKVISLDSHLEDQSSQSASSINFISINTSSVESISQNNSDIPQNINSSVHMLSNKLQPSSLHNSSNSLNSSFGKKQHAPPPPPQLTVKPRHSFLKPTQANPPVSNKTKLVLYPEELNPFAEEEEEIKSTKTISSDIDSTNPFAEFMTDENLNIVDKPVIKPRKRPAPKLPKNVPVVTSKVDETKIFSDNPSDKNMNSSILHSTNVNDLKIDKTKINLHSFPNSQLKQENISNKTDKDTEGNKVDIPEQRPFEIHKSPFKITENSETLSFGSKHHSPLSNNSVISQFVNEEKLKKSGKLSKSDPKINKLGSSKLSIQKAPAPARPLPPKREVRGDNSYEFIPYESLYSQLKELNKKQSEIEIEGRVLQNILWETDQNGSQFSEYLQKWLDLVQKKNDLFVKEGELHEILKRQELEDRHADLEYELRFLMSKQESQKTAAENAREEELINQILDTVNARAQLIEQPNDDLTSKSSTDDRRKSKNTIRKFFTIRHRSSSTGKISSDKSATFKKKKGKTFVSYNL